MDKGEGEEDEEDEEEDEVDDEDDEIVELGGVDKALGGLGKLAL